jgi:hypothetical protein
MIFAVLVSHGPVALTNRLNVIDVIYVDFSRAFDSIVFAKLTAKLGYYGIECKLPAWITAFPALFYIEPMRLEPMT